VSGAGNWRSLSDRGKVVSTIVPVLFVKERPMGSKHASVWTAVVVAMIVVAAIGFLFDNFSCSEGDVHAEIGG
jgi:glucose uptake protein GlcU